MIGFQRGVNFTAEHRVRYGSPESIAQLKKLPAFGIDAIALVPYGATRPGSTTIRTFGGGGLEPDDGIAVLTRVAHDLGMKVLLKPQIWVPGGFPGDLTFPSASDENAWFVEYSKFILHHAAQAAIAKSDLFCIGTEFVKLRDSPHWRPLIAQIRKVYRGPLVYAATQGEEFEQLSFWDALDFIGLNNYYPLPDSLDFASVVAKVEAVQRKHRKPVIFTEAGYASLTAPHRAPWDETKRPLSMQDQARCCEALLQAFYRKPWFQGLYWWKVGTDGFGGPMDGSHTPWGKPAMEAISRWYRSGLRS